MVLIEKAVNEYLNDKAGIVRLSLQRLCDAIDREEAEKRRGEDWSIARDYVHWRLQRAVAKSSAAEAPAVYRYSPQSAAPDGVPWVTALQD